METATICAIVAIILIATLIARWVRSTELFKTLIIAIAIGVVAGLCISQYSSKELASDTSDTEVTQADTIQGVPMLQLFAVEAWQPTMSLALPTGNVPFELNSLTTNTWRHVLPHLMRIRRPPPGIDTS